MFTNESSKWIIAFVLLAVMTIGGTMITGRIMTVGEETAGIEVEVVEGTSATLNPDPNEFTTELDRLRYRGQASRRYSEIYKYASVYEHTGDLDALRAKAAALPDRNYVGVEISDANEFASYLDRLRQQSQTISAETDSR